MQENINSLRICVAGAGAIGSALAVRLSHAGHQVSMIARGKTLATIQEQGLTLHDLKGVTHAKPAASENAADIGVQDIVFVCTKSQDLTTILPTLTPLIGEKTMVIPTINGVPWWYFYKEGGRFDGQHVKSVDPDNLIPDWVPNEAVIGSVIFITAEMKAPGEIHSITPHFMVLGEPSGEMTDRLSMVKAALEAADIEVRATDRIRDNVWTKIIANISSNPLSILTYATLEQIYSENGLQSVAKQVLLEVLLVAAAYGARVPFDPDTFMKMGEEMGPFKTSMLQDLERKRPLELAAIGDAVLELAERYHIPVPVTQAIIKLAHFRGQANLM